jgi:RNA polymerase sigma-70 factor (ECF subfamily)
MIIVINRLYQSDTQIDNEADLVLAAQKDPAAFAPIYRKYLDQVYYYLLARVHQRSEAEDLTALVFLEALEGLPGYREKGNFAAWLFTIVRRRVADYYRSQPSEFDLQEFPDVHDPNQDIMDFMLHTENLQSLDRLIANLDDNEQELLRLRIAAGLKFSDIAAILSRNESSVKMSYYRLLSRMKSQIEAEDDEN